MNFCFKYVSLLISWLFCCLRIRGSNYFKADLIFYYCEPNCTTCKWNFGHELFLCFWRILFQMIQFLLSFLANQWIFCNVQRIWCKYDPSFLSFQHKETLFYFDYIWFLWNRVFRRYCFGSISGSLCGEIMSCEMTFSFRMESLSGGTYKLAILLRQIQLILLVKVKWPCFNALFVAKFINNFF